MSKNIYRTVEHTICYCICLTDHAEVTEFIEYIQGHVKSPEAATKRLRKKYGDQTITVRKIEYRKTRHRMSIDKFVKLSDEMKDVE